MKVTSQEWLGGAEMLNLLKMELRKLKASKLFYFFIFLSLLQAIPVYLLSQRLGITNGKNTFNYMLFLQLSLSSGITIGVFAVDVVCNEFTSAYIKNLISYGHKRRNIYLSKAITAYIGIYIITFIAPIIITIINTHKNGFGEVFTTSSFLFMVKIFLMALIAHTAIGSMAVLVSFIVRKPVAGCVIIMGMDFINRLLNLIYVQKPNLRWALDKYPYMQLSSFFAEEVTEIQKMQSIMAFLCTILISTVLGIYIFKRSDI
ncbi:putative transmembrane protein [Clostridium tetanomorphum]|nr:putative transmembrane protein [Clostridium tetanomorphum]